MIVDALATLLGIAAVPTLAWFALDLVRGEAARFLERRRHPGRRGPEPCSSPTPTSTPPRR